MKDVMLDLETWGTKPGSALRSVGSAFFNPETGAVGAKFYANISRESCVAIGLTIDPGTEKWWSEQSREAQDALLVDQKPFATAATGFHEFFKANGGVRVWCQGANFDSVLWEAACAKAWPSKSFIPWRFWNVRDTRTIYEAAGIDAKAIARAGTYHNALDDSLHQIRCVHEAFKVLRAEQYA
jgi:hypothetical protein